MKFQSTILCSFFHSIRLKQGAVTKGPTLMMTTKVSESRPKVLEFDSLMRNVVMPTPDDDVEGDYDDVAGDVRATGCSVASCVTLEA